jgi:flagellar basal-body rod modification protein FlgD
MATAVTSSTNTTNTTQSQLTTVTKELDRDAFMNLLVTQMQNQDPMNPMKDTEFIAQLAQFSSLEQMQQVNSNLTLLAQMDAASQASSLLGKSVVAGSNGSVTGRVSAVSLEDGELRLMVGNTKLSLSDITRIEQ